jgi:hypothetical protein
LDQHAYEEALAQQVDAIFRANPRLPDHRRTHPGLTGSLGDPFAPVWFLAEAQRLGRRGAEAPLDTPEAQWRSSPGDLLFRAALAEAGFKHGAPEEPGGWRCCVTAMIKAADPPRRRREAKPLRDRMAEAETWAPVLRWQLEAAAPRVLVLKGTTVADLFRHLVGRGAVPLPPHVERIESVTAAAFDGTETIQEERVAAYRRGIRAIARRAGLAPG